MLRHSIASCLALPAAAVAAGLLAAEVARATPPSGRTGASPSGQASAGLPGEAARGRAATPQAGAATKGRAHELLGAEPLLISGASLPAGAPLTAAAPRPAAPRLDPDSPQDLQVEAAAGNSEALAKEAQNPIANLISLPVQWNSTPGTQWAPTAIDPTARHNRTLNVVNIQPVVPLPLTQDLLLVSRTIVPVIHRPLSGASDVIGIGDINPTVFLVPRSNGRLQLGAGPTLVIPSATDPQLGSQRWSAGPAGVAVYSQGPLVAGMLVNNIWSFAGQAGSPVNALLIQPFINYNLAAGWYLITSPIITSDWTAVGGKGWTVPIGGGFGRLFRIGRQPFNASLQAFWNAARPTFLGEQLQGEVTIRAQLQALFPVGR